MNYVNQPLPDTEATETQPFWEGTKQEKLKFPRCKSCGKFHWYPLRRCPSCQSAEIEWVEVKGEGRVFTWTVVRYPFISAFESRLPYIVALVELDEAPGIRLVTNIIESEPDKIKIGLPVEVVFQRITKEVTLPLFKPSSTEMDSLM